MSIYKVYNFYKKGVKNMLKFAFHNLGCKVNSYETDAMIQMLVAAGFTQVDFKDTADIYIVNTCSVTNIADRKSRQMLHKAKSMNPDAIVVATGCYVQAQGNSGSEYDDAVDIVIGNNRKKDIVEVLKQYMDEHKKIYNLVEIGKEKEYEDLFVTDVSEHTRAFIKIQDGCNQFCSYCIIPYTRGRVRSRELESILTEIGVLVMKGFKEFVLTGIHLSSYGVEWEGITLIDVIEAVSKISGVKRIRLGSLEPRIVTREFVDRLAAIPQFCPHFHLSLQSGCDATLKRMNRRYDTAEYYEKCQLIREVFPAAALTTDVIVGFPGETDEEFAVTRDFLDKVSFFEMHVFKYSRRKGTVADRMPNQVNDEIKNVRSDVLLALDEEKSNAFRNAALGTSGEVLIEEIVDFNGIEYAQGHTKTYIKTIIPMADFTDAACVNKVAKVTIKELTADGRAIAGLEEVYAD